MKPHALTDRLGELHAGKENTHTYAFPLHTETDETDACMHCNRLNTRTGSEMNDDTMAKKSICSLSASLSRSLTHIHTHSSAYCSAQDVLSHSYIKLGSTYAGTLSQMYTVGGSAPPVAVRRCYRSCAEVKKRRAARWGHSVGCV